MSRFIGLALVTVAAVAHAAPAILHSIVVHRHGDRSPIVYLPNNPNNAHWHGLATGQLTAEGMSELHGVGSALRARYVDELGLLGTNYTRDQVYIRSTAYDRTLESSYSLQFGMWPPGTGPRKDDGSPGLTNATVQAVPILSVDKAKDPLLRAYGGGACRRYDELHAAQYKSAEWTAMASAHAGLIESLQQTTGLSQPVTLENLNSFNIAQMYATPEMKRLGGGTLVGEIARRLAVAGGAPASSLPIPLDRSVVDSQASSDTGRSFVEYSSHDTTVAALLAALGVFDGEQPPYASTVVFELYRDAALSGSSATTVRIYYNKGPNPAFTNELTLQGCTTAPCSLDEFLSSVRSVIPVDWEAECGNQDSGTEDDLKQARMQRDVLAGVLGAVALALIIWTMVQIRRSRSRSHVRLHDPQPLHGVHERSTV